MQVGARRIRLDKDHETIGGVEATGDNGCKRVTLFEHLFCGTALHTRTNCIQVNSSFITACVPVLAPLELVFATRIDTVVDQGVHHSKSIQAAGALVYSVDRRGFLTLSVVALSVTWAHPPTIE